MLNLQQKVDSWKHAVLPGYFLKLRLGIIIEDRLWYIHVQRFSPSVNLTPLYFQINILLSQKDNNTGLDWLLKSHIPRREDETFYH